MSEIIITKEAMEDYEQQGIVSEEKIGFPHNIKTEYRIISKEYQESFEAEIIDKIKDGWILQGGVAVTSFSDGSCFFSQAIIRHIETII